VKRTPCDGNGTAGWIAQAELLKLQKSVSISVRCLFTIKRSVGSHRMCCLLLSDKEPNITPTYECDERLKAVVVYYKSKAIAKESI